MFTETLEMGSLVIKEEEEDTFSGADEELRASVPGRGDVAVKLESVFVDWIYPIFEDLCNLLSLPPNWDSYGAPQIEKQTVITALETLRFFPNTHRPWVVPTVHGGVRLEWHIGGFDLIIKFEPYGKGLVYYEGPEGIDELEINPRAELGITGKYMDKLPQYA